MTDEERTAFEAEWETRQGNMDASRKYLAAAYYEVGRASLEGEVETWERAANYWQGNCKEVQAKLAHAERERDEAVEEARRRRESLRELLAGEDAEALALWDEACRERDALREEVHALVSESFSSKPPQQWQDAYARARAEGRAEGAAKAWDEGYKARGKQSRTLCHEGNPYRALAAAPPTEHTEETPE